MATDRELFVDLVASAFRIVYEADRDAREFTAEELDDLYYCLSMGCVKLKKLPGGAEAAERVYAGAQAELTRRRGPEP